MALLGTSTTIGLNDRYDSTDTTEFFAEVTDIKICFNPASVNIEINFDPMFNPSKYIKSTCVLNIIFPDIEKTTWSFIGKLSKYDIIVPIEDKITVSVSFEFVDLKITQNKEVSK